MTINCRGKLIDLSLPKVMGIINVTPDSFYDGGQIKTDLDILSKAEIMLEEGATFLDVGGYSSRPGADSIALEEELNRTIHIVKLLNDHYSDAIISIDTFRSKVALEAVNSGAAIINDISAGMLDDKMLETVSHLSVPYIMMHMKGTPQNMNDYTNYEDLFKEIIFYFSERLAEARSLQIKDIIVDPGFGFSKNIEQNYSVLNRLDLFSILEKPLLVGLSRKSMIYKSLGTTADRALNGTTALNSIALQKGAKILRVHDVKEAMECIKLNALLN